VGLLSPIAGALKVLDLSVPLTDDVLLPLVGLCEELEAMAGHSMLEALSLEVEVTCFQTKDFIGPIFQKVEKTLVKHGWFALRQVSFKVSVTYDMGGWSLAERLSDALQPLPDEYLSYLPKFESVAFNF
jgi:hypothetical protein